MSRSDQAIQQSETAQNILLTALESFAAAGYQATSLDQIAAGLGIRKQTILYWFPNKEALLQAVVQRAAAELSEALEGALKEAGGGWSRVEAVVRGTFRLAANRPELLGLVREAGRLGAPAAGQFAAAIAPLLDRATEFLDAEMALGTLRRHDARLLLVSTYSVVVGVATETEVLRALGMDLTPRAYVLRRNEVLNFLKNALVV